MADETGKSLLSKVKLSATKAKEWFKDKVKELKQEITKYSGTAARKRLISGEKSSGVLTNRPVIGMMYLFQYDAKYKDILPYWDVWPLIFPFDYAKGGFYGINFHYLSPIARGNLLQKLWSNNSSGNKIPMSYKIIKQFAATQPCVKRYLFSHIQGKGFYQINEDEWWTATQLPMQKFKGASASHVWKQSALMY